jgi:hypothetical protein
LPRLAGIDFEDRRYSNSDKEFLCPRGISGGGAKGERERRVWGFIGGLLLGEGARVFARGRDQTARGMSCSPGSLARA